MRFAILGSGAVGGYYGARLARAGQSHVHRARRASGRHSRARARDPQPGARRLHRPRARRRGHARVGSVDVVIVAVKAYDNATALPTDRADARPGTDGPDGAERRRQRAGVAAVVGEAAVIGGTTYIATALAAPGRHRADRHAPPHRLRRGVRRAAANDGARAGASTRRWPAPTSSRRRSRTGACRSGRSSFFSSTLAGFTGASRLPIGPLWADPIRSASSFSTAAARSSGSRAPKGVPVARRRDRPHHGLRRRHSRDDAIVAADRSGAGEADRGGGAAGIGRAARGARPACRRRSCRRCMRC